MASISRNHLLASLLVLLFGVPHARPQSTTSIQGTVMERSGARLPGAGPQFAYPILKQGKNTDSA